MKRTSSSLKEFEIRSFFNPFIRKSKKARRVEESDMKKNRDQIGKSRRVALYLFVVWSVFVSRAQLAWAQAGDFDLMRSRGMAEEPSSPLVPAPQNVQNAYPQMTLPLRTPYPRPYSEGISREQEVLYPEIEVVGEGSRYTLGVDDVVQILVRSQPDFSGLFVIGPEGYIQYNYVGDIQAAGLTKDELKAVLLDKLQRFVKYPEVSVAIREYRSKGVFVLGDVAQPGRHAIEGNSITLREALIKAGLPLETAALSRVRVIRFNPLKPEKPRTIKMNAKALLYGGDLTKDLELEAGDVVVVPRSLYRKGMDTFGKITKPLLESAVLYNLTLAEDDNKGIFR